MRETLHIDEMEKDSVETKERLGQLEDSPEFYRQEMSREAAALRREIAELRETVRKQTVWMVGMILAFGGVIIAVVILVR